ncbi:hypothetical protein [Thermotoga sp.]|uniref:hypothetical protein n=1 Tax=Thermotoga sp. TaxID=28240 RepID=UPI0025FB0866|nr:hypothetical protein [Thermotoga sp.]MCD6552151.1 hypothetical protein [Thermotoga sp.]
MKKHLLFLLLIVGGVVFSSSFMWTSDGYRVTFGDVLVFSVYNDEWGVGVGITRSQTNFQKLGFLRVKTSEVTLKTALLLGNGWSLSFSIDQRDIIPFPGNVHYEFLIGRSGGYALLDQDYIMKIGGYRFSLDNFSYMSKDTVMFCSGHISMGSTSFAYRVLNNTALFGISDADSVVFLGVGGLDWQLAGGVGFSFPVEKGLELKFLVSVSKNRVSYGFMAQAKKGSTELTFVLNTDKFYFNVKF